MTKCGLKGIIEISETLKQAIEKIAEIDMEKLVREEVGKLLSVGKENGGIRTTTIMQLLNDLREYSDEQYEEILNLIEEEKINLIVDSTEARTTFLDSSKISIVSKTLSVETIVKK